MAEVRETELPGVGVRYEFHDIDRRAGLGARPSHRRARDHGLRPRRPGPLPYCVAAVGRRRARRWWKCWVRRGSSRALPAAQQDLAGLAIDWLTVASTSQWVGRTLAEAAVHTRTGVSVVAVIRRRATQSTRPGPTSSSIPTIAVSRDRTPRVATRTRALRRLILMPLAASSSDVALVLVELGAIVFGLAIIARGVRPRGLQPDPLLPDRGAPVRRRRAGRPDFTNDFIQVGGEIGVVLLLLALGIEYTAPSSGTRCEPGS